MVRVVFLNIFRSIKFNEKENKDILDAGCTNYTKNSLSKSNKLVITESI